MNIARLEMDGGDLLAGKSSLAAAATLITALVDIEPTNQDWQRDALYVRQEAAWMRWLHSRDPGALTELARVATDVGQLLRGNAGNVEWKRLHAVIHERRARVLLDSNAQGAEAAARTAMESIGDASIAGEPRGDTLVRLRVLRTLGDSLHAQHQQDGARMLWQEALGGAQALMPSDETATLALYADLSERTGDVQAATATRARLASVGYRAVPWARLDHH
jgi:hypothetical protein